jgi:hypothetical protein
MVIDFTHGIHTARRGAAIGTALGLAMLANGQAALADEIRVTGGGHCASEVRLVARDAHLSAVLKRLAQTLDFQLRFESENDPLVSIDTARPLNDLVVRVASTQNLSMTQMRDPLCPNRQRILQVWVLPKGQESQALAAPPAPQAFPLQPTPEQARLAQEGVDMVLRAHGVDPASQAASK